MVAEEVNINEFYWGLKNKFKLEIGLKNNLNVIYPEIIWFKQGIFVITQFNTTQTTNKWTIKIQGKDKMCLLNGDVSGHLPFNVDFGHEEYYNSVTNTTTYKEIPIKNIIYRAVQEFGKELAHNVIIKDIDEVGQALLEYRGTTPLYLFRDYESTNFKQISINNNLKCYYNLETELTSEQYKMIPVEYDFLTSLYDYTSKGVYVFNKLKAENSNDYQNKSHNGWFEGKISDEFSIVYDDLLDDVEFEGNKNPTLIRFNLNEKFIDKRYTIAKIDVGEIPGYRLTDLTYGGELKAAVGESLTSILDKVKKKFTNFEYFYDVDGRFVFQKRPDYLTTSWNIDDEKNTILYADGVSSDVLFNFIDGKLISSFQNTPKLTNLKNDYSVWGTRDKTTMHMRFAIDNKPTEYCPVRSLKEEVMRIVMDQNANIIEQKIMSTKYYDAPEPQPYNSNGLISNNISYQFLELMKNSMEMTFDISDYEDIANLLNTYSDKQSVEEWLNLFEKQNNRLVYVFTGSNEDIKNIFIALLQHDSVYGTAPQYEIIIDGQNYIYNICYSYFANYPYSIKDVYDDENNLIHHKVDWRELIYQMALDYRRLNYTDDFLYYISQANTQFTEGKTGYEQYYIDLEGFWRQLYNPNPEALFRETNYQEVNKETLITDNLNDNDQLDRFYIENPYWPASKEDLETLNWDSIYHYEKPKNNSNAVNVRNSIYGFLGSKDCCLQKSDKDNSYVYYTESIDPTGNAVMEAIQWWDNKKEEDINNYEKLNSMTLNKIYVKNDEAFQTIKSSFKLPDYFQKGIFYTKEKDYYALAYKYDSEEEYYEFSNGNYNRIFLHGQLKTIYKPKTYYLKNDEGYFLSFEEYDDKKIYYELRKTSDYETSFENKKNNVEFKTLVYPRQSNLTTHEGWEVADYIPYVDSCFNDFKNKQNKNETNYFIKSKEKIKLSEFLSNNKLLNLYYTSDLNPLSYYTIDILSELNSIELNQNGEIDLRDVSKYISDITTVYQKYITKLIDKDFNNIKKVFSNLITNLFSSLQEVIKTQLESSKKNSCLSYLSTKYNEFISTIHSQFDFKFNEPLLKEQYNFLMDLIDYNKDYQNLFILEVNTDNYIFNGTATQKTKLKELISSKIIQKYTYEELIFERLTLINNINIHIENLIKSINDNYLQVQLIPQENDNVQKLETIEGFIEKIETLLTSLNLNKDRYYNGQLQITIEQLEALKASAENSQKTLKACKQEYTNIVNDIKALTTFLSNFKVAIFNLFSLTKNTYYKQINDLLIKVSELYKILNITTTNENLTSLILKIKDIIIFNNEFLIESFIDIDNPDNELEDVIKILNEYKSLKNFQEYFIKYNINNFNYIKDNSVIYEPIKYYQSYYAYNHDIENGNYWFMEIYDTPQNLYFWFDFLEPYSSELIKYSVPAIGTRIKVVNDKDVKAIHYKDIPNIIFKSNSQEQYDVLSGYTYINITDNFMNLFSISAKGKTAKERIEELLYNHSYCSENINIQVVPVYHLEPNNKIYIRDDKCNINGKYLINKITIPLNYKKLMTITALKDIDDII